MSKNVKELLSNTQNSKKLSGIVLRANRLGIDPVINKDGRKITLVRVSPLSVRSINKAK